MEITDFSEKKRRIFYEAADIFPLLKVERITAGYRYQINGDNVCAGV